MTVEHQHPDPTPVIETLNRPGIVVVFRGLERRAILRAAEVLVSERHILALEVTAESEGAFAAVRELADEFGAEFPVGLGTVRTVEEASEASRSGATFGVAPGANPDVIQRLRAEGLVAVPGVLTPTEIDTALTAGADMLKVFPAGIFGADHLDTMTRPFGSPPLILSGGIEPNYVRGLAAEGFGTFAIGAPLLGVADAASTGELELRKLRSYQAAIDVSVEVSA